MPPSQMCTNQIQAADKAYNDGLETLGNQVIERKRLKKKEMSELPFQATFCSKSREEAHLKQAKNGSIRQLKSLTARSALKQYQQRASDQTTTEADTPFQSRAHFQSNIQALITEMDSDSAHCEEKGYKSPKNKPKEDSINYFNLSLDVISENSLSRNQTLKIAKQGVPAASQENLHERQGDQSATLVSRK